MGDQYKEQNTLMDNYFLKIDPYNDTVIENKYIKDILAFGNYIIDNNIEEKCKIIKNDFEINKLREICKEAIEENCDLISFGD